MSDFENVDGYIQSFSGDTRKHLEALRTIIRKSVPDAEELINYNIAAFTLRKGAKREEQLMMAGYEKHIGFYPHPSTIEKFWDRLSEYKKGKGSVQFPIGQPLPEALLVEMIQYRLDLINKSQPS